jgi:hypothetical protein
LFGYRHAALASTGALSAVGRRNGDNVIALQHYRRNYQELRFGFGLDATTDRESPHVHPGSATGALHDVTEPELFQLKF